MKTTLSKPALLSGCWSMNPVGHRKMPGVHAARFSTTKASACRIVFKTLQQGGDSNGGSNWPAATSILALSNFYWSGAVWLRSPGFITELKQPWKVFCLGQRMASTATFFDVFDYNQASSQFKALSLSSGDSPLIGFSLISCNSCVHILIVSHSG